MANFFLFGPKNFSRSNELLLFSLRRPWEYFSLPFGSNLHRIITKKKGLISLQRREEFLTLGMGFKNPNFIRNLRSQLFSWLVQKIFPSPMNFYFSVWDRPWKFFRSPWKSPRKKDSFLFNEERNFWPHPRQPRGPNFIRDFRSEKIPPPPPTFTFLLTTKEKMLKASPDFRVTQHSPWTQKFYSLVTFTWERDICFKVRNVAVR